MIPLVLTLRIGSGEMRSGFTLIDSSGPDPKDLAGNEKHLHSLIPLVPDPKDWSGNEKRLHSLILVLTLRIGWVMRSIYTY